MVAAGTMLVAHVLTCIVMYHHVSLLKSQGFVFFVRIFYFILFSNEVEGKNYVTTSADAAPKTNDKRHQP